MSISHCANCDKYVDWDIEIDHFDQQGKCVLAQVQKLDEEGWDPDVVGDALYDLDLSCEY